MGRRTVKRWAAMTTTDDRLRKIRRQLRIAREYRQDNPEWEGAKKVVEILEQRERELTKGDTK
jgi:hypothetical protein